MCSLCSDVLGLPPVLSALLLERLIVNRWRFWQPCYKAVIKSGGIIDSRSGAVEIVMDKRSVTQKNVRQIRQELPQPAIWTQLDRPSSLFYLLVTLVSLTNYNRLINCDYKPQPWKLSWISCMNVITTEPKEEVARTFMLYSLYSLVWTYSLNQPPTPLQNQRHQAKDTEDM